jgi:hypothetical protein
VGSRSIEYPEGDNRRANIDTGTSILDDEMAKEILEQDNDEPGDDGVLVEEEEENDYGYVSTKG